MATFDRIADLPLRIERHVLERFAEPGLPTSPLPPAPSATGFRWGS